jgi:hypothetical protein
MFSQRHTVLSSVRNPEGTTPWAFSGTGLYAIAACLSDQEPKKPPDG